MLVLAAGMENLHQVLMTVVQGAVDVPDPVAQKACFVILRKLVDTWGVQNLICYQSAVAMPICMLAIHEMLPVTISE